MNAVRTRRSVASASIVAIVAASLLAVTGSPAQGEETGPADDALAGISIPNADDIRGNITLPESVNGSAVDWSSSAPDIVSVVADGEVAPGVVTRPAAGADAAEVTLTACTVVGGDEGCRDIVLTVQPSVELAEFTRYGMANFARSNSHAGQQIYMASSVGNDATRWVAVNNGAPVLESNLGMHAVRDPSIVRSPEGDKFYMVATDLNVNGNAYGWRGWDWAQSGASRYIEIWESTDMRNWSPQRHVLVAPEEAGMTFAPEAIWDPEIEAYVVYWSSSMYRTGTYFTTNRTDPNGRYPLTRNQTLYTTTRDFVTFTPWKTMSNRPNHGTLDAVIIDSEDGYYHRLVTDRTSTGPGTTKYVPSCTSEDIYQERATSVRAPEDEWELVSSCITHDAMATRYAEAPLLVKANPSDPRGDGYYMYVDQQWAAAPSGNLWEQQLHPYWGDLTSGDWTPIDWGQKPNYNLANGVIRHGSVFSLTQAEHAALRGADLTALTITAEPSTTQYEVGDDLDLSGLVVAADYTDGVREDLEQGYGGYTVEGFDSGVAGKQTVTVSYKVVDVTKTATFEVVVSGDPDVTAAVTARCVAGKVVLAAAVTNNESAPTMVKILTEYGSKQFAVPAGKTMTHAFTTRAQSVAAGTLTGDAAFTPAGSPAVPIATQYAASSCS